MSKHIRVFVFNAALVISILSANIMLWFPKTVTKPEVIIKAPNPYTAYCITTRTDERGIPIAPYNDDDKDCDCYTHSDCQWGNKFYYYSKMQSSPAVKDNRTLNVMGVEMQAEHYEISRFEYSTYLNDMYKTENGDIIGYKCNSDILTYYYADRSSQFNFSKSIKLSNELITSEEKLREVLDPLVASYINISECEFSYYIFVNAESLTFEELSEKGYVNFATVYVTYQRYLNGIPTNEVLSYVLNLDGYLRDFQLSGYGEFENLSEFNFDADTWSNIRDSKIRDMYVRYSEPEKLDRWERLAYIDGQYILVVEIYLTNRNAESFTARIAIPITRAPENAPVTVIPEETYTVPMFSLPIKVTVTTVSAVLLSVTIIVSIIISRKKSTQIPSEQEEQTE